MKQVHPLTLKLSHAVAKRIKANQSQRAQLYAFSPRVFEPPRPNPPKRPLVIPKLAPLPKGASKAGALLAGALLAGGPLKAVAPNNVWNTVYWLGHDTKTMANGIAYIDPLLKDTLKCESYSWIGTCNYNANYNPNGNFLDTYSSTGGGFSLNFNNATNTDTLIIGNDKKDPAKGGTVQIGGVGGNGGLVGYVTGTMTAPNIYMTNIFKTGNEFKTGGGTDITFKATQNFTADGLYYQTLKAGTQRSNSYFQAGTTMKMEDMHYVDETGGITSIHSDQETIITNSDFSGSGTEMHFEAKKNGVNNGTLSMTNTSITGMSGLAIEGKTSTFNNVLFDAKKTNFKADQLQFTDSTFAGEPTYTFQSMGANGQNSVTFAGVNTILTGSSPFLQLKSNVTIAPGAVFNITQGLKVGQDYTLFDNPDKIMYGGQKLKNLSSSQIAQILQFQGLSSSNTTSTGNDQATLEDTSGGYKTFEVKATWNNGKLVLNPITIPTNVWESIFWLGKQGVSTSFNTNGGVAYVNPLLKNTSGPCYNAVLCWGVPNPGIYNANYNPNGNLLPTYVRGAGGDFTININGGGVFVMGNSRAAPATGGTVWFGNQALATGGTRCLIACGFINAKFKADNDIYLTNTIKTGTFAFGGGANLTFQAGNNLTADGLTYENIITVFPGMATPFGSQHSTGYLIAKNDLTILNSIFSDASWGGFSFSGHKSLSMSNSDVQGSQSAIQMDSPTINLVGSTFGLGLGSNIYVNGFGNGNNTTTSTGAPAGTAVSAVASNTLFSLNQESRAHFLGDLVLKNNSGLWLNNASQAEVVGTLCLGSSLNPEENAPCTKIVQDNQSNQNQNSQNQSQNNQNQNNQNNQEGQEGQSAGTESPPLHDNSVINLDHQSTLTLNGGTYFMDSARLSLLNQSTATFKKAITLADNAVLSVNSGSTITFSDNALFGGESTLGINDPNSNVKFEKDATFSGSSSLILSNQATATIKGTTELDDGVNINLAGASSLNMQALNLNGADVALMGQSTLTAGDTTSTGSSSFYSKENSTLEFGSFNLDGSLTLKGILTPNIVKPYMDVKGAFKFGSAGLLDISNVDIFTALPHRTSKVYSIINTTQGFTGISGADGYKRIDFYGMKITDATYDAAQNSWSFANPLNGAQTITESLQNNKLVVTISQSLHPVETSLFNIAPELYYYRESRQNVAGTQYDYQDARTGTFFLDSNLKGVFIPPTTSMTNPLIPEIPGTYGAYNQPLDPLHIYNPAITQANLSGLYNLASGLWPQLESLLKSGVLSNLNDPTKVMQALENAHVTLTPEQKQELTDLIGGLSARINQTFENGTLVVGGAQVGKTQSDSVIWFGGNGYSDTCSGPSSCQELRSTNLGQLLESTSVGLGYIDATFNAKDIYITGTLGSGNAWQTGGSASVSFNSASDLTLNEATITAEGTDQIFPLLGQEGFYKILGQAGLGQTLGNLIYEKAAGDALLPSSIQSLGGLLPSSIADKPLGDLFDAKDMSALLELPDMMRIIKEVVSSKTVGSLLGDNGLIQDFSEKTRNWIYGQISDAIGKASPAAQTALNFGGGLDGARKIINGFYSKDTLWTLMNQLAPLTGMTLQQAIDQAGTDAGIEAAQKFLNDTTFGQILKTVLTQQDLINKSVAWLGPQILGSMMDVAIQNVLNPPPALTDMLGNTTAKLLNQLLGPDLLNTLNQLSQQKDLQAIANAIMQDKGLGGLWSRGLGSVLSDGLQKQLKEVGVGNLLAPKGLSWLWEKGYFSFMGAQNVFVNNSKFSNATGGALSFVAGDKIVFNGTNSIDFTNYAGTLNFFSNNQSDIEVSTLNATNGLNINAQFNNVTVKAGTLTTNNEYEGINVSALNFNYLGTIEAKGGKVDLSAITGKTLLGTINLAPNTSLLANNLSIKDALNNASTRIPIQPQTSPNQPPPSDSAVQIAQDFTLYSGATLTTNPSGINVGGAFSSQGSMLFNAGAQNANTPFIDVKGIATLKPTADTPPLSLNTQANNAAYTLVQAKWIDYNLYNKPFNPNSWKDYLSLYTQLSVNGGRMELNARGDGLVYNGKAVDIANRGLSVSYENAQGQKVTSSIAYNNIQVGVGKQPDIVVPTIQEYIQQIQGSSSVQAVYKAGGPRVMEWLSALLVDTKNTPLFAPYYLENNSSATLVKMAKDIANSIDLIASPSLKNNSTDILQLNTYTQQMSRLAKLSNFTASVPTFHDFLEDIKGERFASAVPNAMDVILAYSQRDKIKNNLWMQGVGGASFVAGGTGTLYGINVGYDRFVKGAIVGGYVAYAYSGFHGNIVNANSNNVNVGLYSRIFAKNSEITLSANETWGYNKNYVNAANPILSIVNQRYKYNTWTTNVGVNYGYDFFFKNKSVVLKPQIAMRYYYIGLSSLQGIMDNPIYDRFKANADPNKKSVLTLNVALESRHYFGKNSYYFVIADIGRDLFVHSLGDKLVRFIGNNTLSYRKGGLYNTFASLTMGGEVRLWKSLYVNAGIGARFGLDYQDINITGNMGMRYAF
ncbi:vacuolating cytotoxin domain-containing protein [Helicobacter salomonis]|uniref:vacuolating cytotoxin domain-containing protein n=1 Tax=Helicobacter salomonis TaxID=56878 RepID=UPI001B337A84|nr:vacuolating cytotoxin domain-containing protein [Helicobacter salomonis]